MCIEYVLVSFTVKKEFHHPQVCTLISVWVRPSVHTFATREYAITFEPHQTMHHSAGNYQFAIHTFLLTRILIKLRSPFVVHILRYFRSKMAHIYNRVRIFAVHVV